MKEIIERNTRNSKVLPFSQKERDKLHCNSYTLCICSNCYDSYVKINNVGECQCQSLTPQTDKG